VAGEDAQQGHFGAKRLSKLHKREKKTEDGACLTGHQASYSKKTAGKQVSCNYRYQAHEQAKAESSIKSRLHGYPTNRTAAIRTALKVAPPRYSTSIAPPRKGDWDLDGPTSGPIVRKNKAGRKVTIPVTMNFSQDTWPYWNNAHHLIPKGTLKDVIVSNKPAVISNMIQQGLLDAKYNVNHKKNMLMIPQDREVADLLDMPRHIQLKEGDDPNISAQVFNHPEYNDMVEVGLKKIIRAYTKTADNAYKNKTGHAIPNITLSKARLVKLSGSLLTLVLSWGSGVSLDSKANVILKKATAAILKLLGVK